MLIFLFNFLIISSFYSSNLSESFRFLPVYNLSDLIRLFPEVEVYRVFPGFSVSGLFTPSTLNNNILFVSDELSEFWDFQGSTLFGYVSEDINSIKNITFLRGRNIYRSGENFSGGIVSVETRAKDKEDFIDTFLEPRISLTGKRGFSQRTSVIYGKSMSAAKKYPARLYISLRETGEDSWAEPRGKIFSPSYDNISGRAFFRLDADSLISETDVRISGGFSDFLFPFGLFSSEHFFSKFYQKFTIKYGDINIRTPFGVIQSSSNFSPYERELFNRKNSFDIKSSSFFTDPAISFNSRNLTLLLDFTAKSSRFEYDSKTKDETVLGGGITMRLSKDIYPFGITLYTIPSLNTLWNAEMKTPTFENLFIRTIPRIDIGILYNTPDSNHSLRASAVKGFKRPYIFECGFTITEFAEFQVPISSGSVEEGNTVSYDFSYELKARLNRSELLLGTDLFYSFLESYDFVYYDERGDARFSFILRPEYLLGGYIYIDPKIRINPINLNMLSFFSFKKVSREVNIMRGDDIFRLGLTPILSVPVGIARFHIGGLFFWTSYRKITFLEPERGISAEKKTKDTSEVYKIEPFWDIGAKLMCEIKYFSAWLGFRLPIMKENITPSRTPDQKATGEYAGKGIYNPEKYLQESVLYIGSQPPPPEILFGIRFYM